MTIFHCKKFLAVMAVIWLMLAGPSAALGSDWADRVRQMAPAGAVLVKDAVGKVLFSHHPEQPKIPASTLKIVTAAAALDVLGHDYRFITDFRLSPQNDLYVIGRGDPYLVSEELAGLARTLRSKGLKQINNILLDNSFFQEGLVLDGTSRSLNPYDAYNGALCVNFNTIHVQVGPDQRISSAEPQTPLTDLARKLASQNRARGKVRFNLAESPEVCLVYAGELLKRFLEEAGVAVNGQVRPAAHDSAGLPLLHRHRSSRDLCWLLSQMFEYSNNFMANQIFLTMGAERFGPPADPEKSRRVVAEYLAARGIEPFHVEEGSGLSRRTKVSAAQMIEVLRFFSPYRHLLPAKGPVRFKTGTLSDVKSLAGYLLPEQGAPLSFVILLNGPGLDYRTRDRILALLEENLL